MSEANQIERPVMCHYCGNPAALAKGADIYPHRPDLEALRFWRCEPCGAYVGCHKAGNGYGDGTQPLGRLANADLRTAKQAAHAAIDPYWRAGRLRRREVYSRLAALMNLGQGEAHIGEFDEAQCAEAVQLGRNAILWDRP